MVPVAPMQIDVAEIGDERIELTAPLAQHVNDKGNAFGGSLSSIMTLACWGLMTAKTRAAGLTCDVYVGEITTKYLKPIEEDLRVTAWFVEPEEIEGFVAQLHAKGKARLEMKAQTTLSDGTAAATLTGRFVAFVK